MESGMGTPKYTDRYILFEGGWEGIFFFCDQSSNPVDIRADFLENRAAFFFHITLGTKVQPLEEY
jgi:hypothetical protein